MRAITLESFDRSPGLHEVPTPQIGSGEVLVRVHASSINALVVKVAAGMLQGMLEYRFPVTMGRDLAGVVEQVGSEVSRYLAGDEVFGFLGFRAGIARGLLRRFCRKPRGHVRRPQAN